MARSKRNSEEAEENTSSWMATYSDMVTLLMTFFVLMFAISNVDAQKFALLAKGLSRDGITAEDFIDIQDKYDLHGVGDPNPDDIQFPGEDDKPKPTPAPAEGEGEGGELGNLHALIVDYISQNKLEDSMQVIFQGDKLMLTLSNDIWFSPGSADITSLMREKAGMMAQLLADTQNEEQPFDVIVVGHTDNTPINTQKYPSNWELSVDRAVKFLQVLIYDSGLSSNNFSARGCGEELPVADNETSEGRQKNRRVEVLISQPKQQQ